MNRFESVNENFPSVRSKEVEEERGLRKRESGKEDARRIKRKKVEQFKEE